MIPTLHPEMTPEYWNKRSEGQFPGLIGITILGVEPGVVTGRLEIQQHHLAGNGYLHAATVVGLADTISGYGCVAHLPEAATGFTTVELKSNHVGTARSGAIHGRATLTHAGRTTQVWDAEVTDESTGKLIALFRCTQMVLYSK